MKTQGLQQSLWVFSYFNSYHTQRHVQDYHFYLPCSGLQALEMPYSIHPLYLHGYSIVAENKQNSLCCSIQCLLIPTCPGLSSTAFPSAYTPARMEKCSRHSCGKLYILDTFFGVCVYNIYYIYAFITSNFVADTWRTTTCFSTEKAWEIHLSLRAGMNAPLKRAEILVVCM